MALLPMKVQYHDNRGNVTETRPWPSEVTMLSERLNDAPKLREKDSWTLCANCLVLCSKIKEVTHDVRLDPEEQVLLRSVAVEGLPARGETRCSLCQLMLSFLPDIRANEVIEIKLHLGRKGYTWTHSGRSDIEVGHAVHIHREDHEPSNIPIATLEGDDLPDLMSGIEPLQDSDTASVPAFSLLKSWLHDCITSHGRKCLAYPPEDARMPSRLINVGPADGSKPPFVDLMPEGVPFVPYICLSYQWGSANVIKLTTETFETYAQRLPHAELSRTIQDAILISRRLGVRYLWVDALCIIQDSEDDWASESQRMQSIYQNALLTVAVAPSGRAPGTGIFTTRRSGRLRPVQVPVDDDLKLYAFPNMRTNHDHESELETRAWTLQERLLSPRTAIYKSGQIFFECGWHTVAESAPSKFANSINTSNPRYFVAMFRMRHTYDGYDPHSQLQEDLWEQCWRGIVEDYSARHLTYEKDRMMALQGIAKELQERKGDQYVVGLWQHRIWEHLLWKAKPGTDRYAEGQFSGPSWSWMSIPRPVTYEDVPLASEANKGLGLVLEYDFRFEGGSILPSDTLAEVNGRLFIRGGLVKMWRRPESPSRLHFTESSDGEGEADWIPWSPDGSSESSGPLYMLRVLSNDYGAHFLCVAPWKSEDRNDDVWTFFHRLGVCKVIVPCKYDYDEETQRGKMVKDMMDTEGIERAERIMERTTQEGFWDDHIILE